MRKMLIRAAVILQGAALGAVLFAPPAGATPNCTLHACLHAGGTEGFGSLRLTALVPLAGGVMLSVSAVAAELGVSEQTVRMWCRTGLIPSIRPAGTRKWRIPEDAFKAWMAESGTAVSDFMKAPHRDPRSDEELVASVDDSNGGSRPPKAKRGKRTA